MVDFNNDTTVTTPPGDVVKIVILERREQVIEALENYHNVENASVDLQHKENTVHARILALWYELEAIIARRLEHAKGTEQDPNFAMVKNAITFEAKKFAAYVEAFEWMNAFIDELGLTNIDIRPKYDRRNVEDSNQKKGM